MAVGKHQQETMAEHEGNTLACQPQIGEPPKLSEDVADAVRQAAPGCLEDNDGKPIAIVAKWWPGLHRYSFRPMVKSFTFPDAVEWMRHGGPCRGFLMAAVRGSLANSRREHCYFHSSNDGGSVCTPFHLVVSKRGVCELLRGHVHGGVHHGVLFLINHGGVRGSSWLWRSHHRLHCVFQRVGSHYSFRLGGHCVGHLARAAKSIRVWKTCSTWGCFVSTRVSNCTEAAVLGSQVERIPGFSQVEEAGDALTNMKEVSDCACLWQAL